MLLFGRNLRYETMILLSMKGGGYYDCSKKIDCTIYNSTALKDV